MIDELLFYPILRRGVLIIYDRHYGLDPGLHVIYQTREGVFHQISKHREVG